MNFTLEYWEDDGWLVGRLKEYPSVMSQGENLEHLQANIREVYDMLRADAVESSDLPAQHQETVITL